MKNRVHKKVWFVEHPTSQYKEDVTALAAQAQLEVIDANFRGQVGMREVIDKKDEPKLTAKK